MKKFKKGDKLLCIKTLKHLHKIYFYKNKLYEIIEVTEKTITIEDELKNNFNRPFNGVMFKINNEYGIEDEYKLDDYFNTISHMRKLKLNKLNNIN